jgi:hypothetical protein
MMLYVRFMKNNTERLMAKIPDMIANLNSIDL